MSMSCIHLLSCRTLWTVLFFRLYVSYMEGAILRGLFWSIQGTVQKLALRPFPKVTRVRVLKRVQSISSHGCSNPTQGLSVVVHCTQSQRSLSTLATFCKWRILRPPKLFGLQTCSQLTLQFPLETASVLDQKKVLLFFYLGSSELLWEP